MNGQMRNKHANGGRKEFASMKKITQVLTLNLCPAKNLVRFVYINECFPLWIYCGIVMKCTSGDGR